tara:strand:- start:20 stop:226 length:207 start_codon:yes stop_codon:yes gene_type:complete
MQILKQLTGYRYSKKYKFFYISKKDYFRQLYNLTDMNYWNKNAVKKKKEIKERKRFDVKRGKFYIYFN